MANNNSRKLKVALDVDGVLVDVVEIMLQIRKENGFTYTRENLGKYPGPGKVFMGLDNDGFENMYNEMWEKRWRQLKGTVSEAELIEFCKNFDVVLLTSRYENTIQPLKDWLALNYPRAKLEPTIIPKGTDRSQMPFDIYIDDAPDLADKVKKLKNKRLFLVYAGYNKDVVADGRKVIKVRTLSEAFKLLNKEVKSSR